MTDSLVEVNKANVSLVVLDLIPPPGNNKIEEYILLVGVGGKVKFIEYWNGDFVMWMMAWWVHSSSMKNLLSF